MILFIAGYFLISNVEGSLKDNQNAAMERAHEDAFDYQSATRFAELRRDGANDLSDGATCLDNRARS